MLVKPHTWTRNEVKITEWKRRSGVETGIRSAFLTTLGHFFTTRFQVSISYQSRSGSVIIQSRLGQQGYTVPFFPKIDISVHLTNISGVGKSDRYGLGHPGGLITRKPVVQIYSPLLVFIS